MKEYSDCIFVAVPEECSFFIEGKCASLESHIVACSMAHRNLIIKEEAKEVLLNIFRKVIVDSSLRVKPASGQEGKARA